MRDPRTAELLLAAKHLAQKEHDILLAYLIEMALTHIHQTPIKGDEPAERQG